MEASKKTPTWAAFLGLLGAWGMTAFWATVAWRAMRALEIIASPACGCEEKRQEERHQPTPELLLTEVK